MPSPPRPSRGEVWDIKLEPVEGHEQGGVRPAVILSANTFNAGPREMVIIVPMTTRHRPSLDNFRVEVRPPNGGVTSVSYVIPDQIRAVSTSRFAATSRRGLLSPDKLAIVEDRVRVVLDL
jgi:mRNA interferase MazF